MTCAWRFIIFARKSFNTINMKKKSNRYAKPVRQVYPLPILAGGGGMSAMSAATYGANALGSVAGALTAANQTQTNPQFLSGNSAAQQTVDQVAGALPFYSVGKSIGKYAESDYKAQNEYGELANTGKFKTADTISTFIDPLGSLVSGLSGEGWTANQRADKINAQGAEVRKQAEAQKAAELKQLEMGSHPGRYFDTNTSMNAAYGGSLPMYPEGGPLPVKETPEQRRARIKAEGAAWRAARTPGSPQYDSLVRAGRGAGVGRGNLPGTMGVSSHEANTGLGRGCGGGGRCTINSSAAGGIGVQGRAARQVNPLPVATQVPTITPYIDTMNPQMQSTMVAPNELAMLPVGEWGGHLPYLEGQGIQMAHGGPLGYMGQGYNEFELAFGGGMPLTTAPTGIPMHYPQYSAGGDMGMLAEGGQVPIVNEYNVGGTHEESSYGGVPVDNYGTPSAVSGRNPVAKSEQGELTWFNPKTKSAYVFSNRLFVDK